MNIYSKGMAVATLLSLCSIGSVAAESAPAPIVTAQAENEFESIIAERGGIVNDLSDSKKIVLDEPSLAYVNITGIEAMPLYKTDELHAWLEYFDTEGNYFKKRIIIGAQGSSSLGYPKKNCKFDICEDEWIGDKTTDVTFGDWVKQDSFHLKAFFIDYFRGAGETCYRLYDQVVADRGDMAHAWQRSGVTDADPKAKGHPDAFPSIVYLNGKFYGIFAWQLKKHRKNMGMDKATAEHIHLDGEIGYSELFNMDRTVKWTSFEIRNPKDLYCQDGSKYDGDNPTEIMGENSPHYDASNAGHVRTAKVKEYIQNLAAYSYALNQYERRGYTDEQMREEVAKRLDIEAFTDYTVFSAVTNNVDGYWKNWQWTTYDGVKWTVEPYDLDMTFGNVSFGYFVSPPEYNWYYANPNERFRIDHGVNSYFHKYFEKDIDKRYGEMRDSGVFTVNNIMGLINGWYERIGEDNYTREFARWPESLCNREMIVSPQWEWTGSWVNFQQTPEWNERSSYRKGETVRAGNMIFKALELNSNCYPVIRFGYVDSLDRITDWITRRIELQDYYMHYTPSGVESPAETAEAANAIVSIHDITGVARTALQPGINIVTYSDGRTAKIIK